MKRWADAGGCGGARRRPRRTEGVRDGALRRPPNVKDEGGGGRGLRDSSTEADAAANQQQARLPLSGAVVVSGGRRLTSACLTALSGGRRT